MQAVHDGSGLVLLEECEPDALDVVHQLGQLLFLSWPDRLAPVPKYAFFIMLTTSDVVLTHLSLPGRGWTLMDYLIGPALGMGCAFGSERRRKHPKQPPLVTRCTKKHRSVLRPAQARTSRARCANVRLAPFACDILRVTGTMRFVFKWPKWRVDEKQGVDGEGHGLPVPVIPCAGCGHDTSNHPWPGRKDLTACTACIWEEDVDRRRAEDICRRQFPRHQG